MIPSRRLLLLALFGILLATVYSGIPVSETLFGFPDRETWQPKILWFWGVYMGGLFLTATLDLVRGLRTRKIRIKRTLPNKLAIGAWIRVNLEIRHRFRKPAVIQIFDHYPSQVKTQQLPLSVKIVPGRTSRTYYRLLPLERGDFKFRNIQYRIASSLGLWTYNFFSGEPFSIKVYPDFAKIKRYILLGREDRTSQLGIKRQQRRGVGLEFHRLRKYRLEDSVRQIDWKATSKKRQLISREYEDEKNQQVFFLLDCGRRMRSKDDDLSHFDYALNSMLLLGYVALKQGDAVGLMSFSGHRNVWLNSVKGVGKINKILNTVYNLQACTHDSDYSLAAELFFKRHKKRSLVVLISNARDENVEELLLVLALLKKRHLVLFANLREQVLDTIIETPVQDFHQAISYAATTRFLQKRSETAQEFSRRGIITLDVTAPELPIAIVNIYHKLKRSGQL